VSSAERCSAVRWWASLRQPFDGAQDKAQGRPFDKLNKGKNQCKFV